MKPHTKRGKDDEKGRLTPTEARQIVRMLGEYQTYLEELIDSCLLPGEKEPTDKSLRPSVVADRRKWNQAEAIVKKLSASRRHGQARDRGAQ